MQTSRSPARGDVWWVDLAAATSGELMPSVVLGALGAIQQPGRDVSESVVEFLAVGGGLVVFSVMLLGAEQHVAQGLSLVAQIPPTSAAGIRRYWERGNRSPWP